MASALGGSGSARGTPSWEALCRLSRTMSNSAVFSCALLTSHNPRMDSAVPSLSSSVLWPGDNPPAEPATEVAADVALDAPAKLASLSELYAGVRLRCLEPLLLVDLKLRLLGDTSGLLSRSEDWPSCCEARFEVRAGLRGGTGRGASDLSG